MNEGGATAVSELTCVRCGYDLRGRPLDAPCPECGLAGHRSVLRAGQGLADCPPGWVARVAAGALLMFVAYLGPVVSAGLGVTGIDHRAWILRPIATTVFLAVHVTGVFLITAREPGGRARVGERLAAWALRVCSVAPVLAVPLFWHLAFWWVRLGYVSILVVSYASVVPCPALTMWRLRRLTCRVGRPRVAEHAAIAGCGLSAALGTIFLLMLTDVVEQTWVIAVVTATLFVCYVWTVVLLLLVTRSLRAAAREAREAWRAADASQAVGGASVSGGEVLESGGQ